MRDVLVGMPGGYGSMVGDGLEETGYGMDWIGSDWDQTGDDACLAALRGLAAVRVMLFCMLFVSYRCDGWGMDSALRFRGGRRRVWVWVWFGELMYGVLSCRGKGVLCLGVAWRVLYWYL